MSCPSRSVCVVGHLQVMFMEELLRELTLLTKLSTHLLNKKAAYVLFGNSQMFLIKDCVCCSADISTDGRWCFVVLWVTPIAYPSTVRWPLLKRRLEGICPSALAPCWLPPVAPPLPESQRVLLLRVCSSDRTGLLHGISLLQFTSS